MVVRASIDETDIPLVKPGQRTMIHLQYDEEITLHGKVDRISPKGLRDAAAAASGDDVATFETIISIDAPPTEIRLGMTANVEIEVQRREDVLSIPTPAVLHRRAKDLPTDLGERLKEERAAWPGVDDPARRYHQVVLAKLDDKASYRLVKTGISDERHVEILDGLKEGEMVISGPYRVFEKLGEGRTVKQTEKKSTDGGK